MKKVLPAIRRVRRVAAELFSTLREILLAIAGLSAAFAALVADHRDDFGSAPVIQAEPVRRERWEMPKIEPERKPAAADCDLVPWCADTSTVRDVRCPPQPENEACVARTTLRCAGAPRPIDASGCTD